MSSSSSSSGSLPLSGVKVVEFAGLAPGPFVGLVLSDFGADVIRIDKVGASFNPDSLCRGKRSVSVDPKKPSGLRTLRKLCAEADIVIDPFRPGVMERLGLGPEDVHKGNREQGVKANERAIYARLTGFQRKGPYANMAGHDINYIALSGVLSILGNKQNGPPVPPANLLGDFAGGSMICLLGVLLALFERTRSGKGQVVEADMVAGARYVSTFVLLTSYLNHPTMGDIMGDGTNAKRAQGTLDGGSPWYGVYECSDGLWMSVGAIEPQFYKVLLQVLEKNASLPSGSQRPSAKTQSDRETWPALRQYFEGCFRQKTQREWTALFVGTDACVAPVLTRDEAAVSGFEPSVNSEEVQGGSIVVPSPAPLLSRTPANVPAGSAGQEGQDKGGAELLLTPGEHTNEILSQWAGIEGAELGALYRDGAVDGNDAPEGSAGSKL